MNETEKRIIELTERVIRLEKQVFGYSGEIKTKKGCGEYVKETKDN